MMSCVLAASSSQDSIPMRGSDDPGYNFVCSAWAERKASLKMALHVGQHRAFVCCSMVFWVREHLNELRLSMKFVSKEYSSVYVWRIWRSRTHTTNPYYSTLRQCSGWRSGLESRGEYSYGANLHAGQVSLVLLNDAFVNLSGASRTSGGALCYSVLGRMGFTAHQNLAHGTTQLSIPFN